MQVAVTGANGYLGSVITQYLISNGLNVIKLVRNPSDSFSRKFVLGNEVESDIFTNIDCLIHVAHDFVPKRWGDIEKVNINGAHKLFKAAKSSGVKKIIFISSMSSYIGCKSNYGKSKYLIEQDLISNFSGYIVRPGLIYGEKNGGMVSALTKLAALPILPLIEGNAKLYFCNYNDLMKLINQIIIAQIKFINVPIIAANSKAYSFKQILKILGAKFLVPIPWRLVWLMLKCIETLGINLRTGSDSLVSLVNQDSKPDFSVLKSMHIKFADFNIGKTNL